VFIINPGEVHTYQISPEQQLEIINCLFLPHLIGDDVLRSLKITDSMDYFYVQPFLDNRERFHHRMRLRGDEAKMVLYLLEDMIREKDSGKPGHTTLIRLKLIELLILLSRFFHASRTASLPGASAGELAVRRISGYLERHCHQKISLPSLSGLFGISVRQLNRLFKKEAGVSVMEMIQQIRIERAKQLLRETDEKVIHIAAAVGYENPAFFSRLFTRLAGCSPGKFRSMSRNGGQSRVGGRILTGGKEERDPIDNMERI